MLIFLQDLDRDIGIELRFFAKFYEMVCNSMNRLYPDL